MRPVLAPADLHRDGFRLFTDVLTPPAVQRLVNVFAGDTLLLRRNRAAYGGRTLLNLPPIVEIAASPAIRRLVEPVIGPAARPVRGLFFDKTPEANWPVLWHQDLSLAVAERHDLDGWGPWSTKAGIWHVQPPTEILEGMLTVRLHVDDCSALNGPLRVLPGTHRVGRLSRDRIAELRRTTTEVQCVAPAGSALVMRPLLLHASSPARTPNHRRVIHLEFAAADALPAPLAWAA